MTDLVQKDFSKVPNVLAWLKEVFADERNFTKGMMFRGPTGHQAEYHGTVAQCCLMGGVFLSTRDAACRHDTLDAIRTTPACSRWRSITGMNDNGGLEAVRTALDQAVIMFPREG